MSNIGDKLKIYFTNSFESLLFLANRRTVPWILQNSILILNFILLIFRSLFGWRRDKEVVIFLLREKKSVRWWGIQPPKQLFFVSNSSIYWGELKLCVFCLPWKHIKKYIWAWKFFLGAFRVLGRFFAFFMAINWFNKVSKVFHRCFEPKISFWVKQQRIMFFQSP